MRNFTLLSLVLSLSLHCAHGQTQMINPTTHPFSVADMEIFPDGTVYMTSDYYSRIMVRMKNIEKPQQGKPEFIFLKNRQFKRIECMDKQHCIGWQSIGYPDKMFRTEDGGRTWQRAKHLEWGGVPIRDVEVVNRRFVIFSTGKTLSRSLDQGLTRQAYGQKPLGYFQHLGHNDRFAFYRKEYTDSIFQVSPSQIRFFTTIGQWPGIQNVERFEPTAKGYLIVHDTGQYSLLNLSLSNITQVATNTGFIRTVLRSGDTLAAIKFPANGVRLLEQTHDGGLTWQSDTLQPAPDNRFPFWYFGSDKVDGIHKGKIYFSEGQHGRWRIIDILRKKEYFVNSNRYPYSALYLERLDSNTYIFDTGELSVQDSSTRIAFLDAQGKEKRSAKVRLPDWHFLRNNRGSAFKFQFKDAQVGFGYQAITGQLIFTHNGGRTWTSAIFDSLNLPIASPKFAQFLPDINEILLLGSRKMVFLDTRFNFLHQQSSTRQLAGGQGNNQLEGFYFKNRQEGIVAINSSLIYTQDGGKTYTTLLPSNKVGPNTIDGLVVYDSGIYLWGSSTLFHSKKLSGPFNLISDFRGFRRQGVWDGFFTESQKFLDYDAYRNLLHFSADSGQTFQTSPFIADGDLTSVHQTTDSTYLLTAWGGQMFILEVTDSLIVADSSSNFIPINFGNGGSGNPVGLQEEVSRIAFFPNPAQRQLTLQFTDAQPRTLKIYDLQGRLQLSRKVQAQQVKLPIAELPGGMYVLQVHLPQGGVRAMKFLKME